MDGSRTVAFEAVKLLPDTIAGAEIVKQEVPTEFIRAGEVLEAAIQANQPDVVICIGQAGGRSAITPGCTSGSCTHRSLQCRTGRRGCLRP